MLSVNKSFRTVLDDVHISSLRHQVEILQINVGKLCNQACRHCHVEAGPNRTEIMEPGTMDRILSLLENAPTVHTVDITGGAPELCPDFRRLVVQTARLGKSTIDRCNLTVFFEKDQKDLPDFLAHHRVRVMASLPCYTESNVDKQRGRGVFGKSILALQRLNALGYGKSQSGLSLDLVYNPLGPFLPPPQDRLESDYRVRLAQDFGIEFNRLFCITNMPIKRFYDDLKRTEKLSAYMDLLLSNFNPHAAREVMCRSLISIGWDGKIYDCDFNQMLDLRVKSGLSIWDITSFHDFNDTAIQFDDHCFGCTAGPGSSCTGTLEKPNR